MLILQYLKSLGGLLQVDGQMNPVVHRPKDETTDPRAKILEVQAPLCVLLKLDNNLPHDIRLEDLSGQAPKHRLSGRGQCHPECRKPCSHLGVVGGCKLHSLVQRVLRQGAIYGQAHLRPSEP
jgi:hypothetical protein